MQTTTNPTMPFLLSSRFLSLPSPFLAFSSVSRDPDQVRESLNWLSWSERGTYVRFDSAKIQELKSVWIWAAWTLDQEY